MKRGGYIKRSSPLSRKRGIRPKRSRRVANKTEGERDFTVWLHEQRCIGDGWQSHDCSQTRSWNPIEQSHERNMTGLGLKASDFRSIPMCRELHRQWEEHRLNFSRWSKEKRRVWFSARIIETQARYTVETGKAAA